MSSRIKESPESTFEVYLEVAKPGQHISGPEVQRQFPADYPDQETLLTVPKFCFPFSMDRKKPPTEPEPGSKGQAICQDRLRRQSKYTK